MAVFDLAMSLRQGRFTLQVEVRMDARVLALYGPSGSGKTTMLEVMAGLRTPDGGRVVVDGRCLFDSVRGINEPARSRAIGYVPQDVLLFPHMDVRRNVEYGWRGDVEVMARLVEWLELDGLLSRDVASLSGGERQRVALARALAASPRLLLLDEPLAAVDLARRRRIIDALWRVRDELSTPIVYVTHAQEEVRLLADVAAVLDSGRLVARGTPDEVLP